MHMIQLLLVWFHRPTADLSESISCVAVPLSPLFPFPFPMPLSPPSPHPPILSLRVLSRLGMAPIHHAARCGDLPLVIRLWLDDPLSVHSADYSEGDHDGFTPLHLAAMVGRDDVVAWLVDEAGADLEAWLEGERVTPLSLAVEKGHLGVTATLLARGASAWPATVEEGGGQWGCLLTAVIHGHPRVLELLLERVPGVLAILDHGYPSAGATAVWWAASLGEEGCLWALLQAGGDPDLHPAEELLPVDVAREKGYSGCVVLLEVSECMGRASADHRKRERERRAGWVGCGGGGEEQEDNSWWAFSPLFIPP